ncbi:hypothetical protein [Thermococcus sp.]|uniref:hypothetical protein n=1 Tax=Thermococcus sp. TaxID=35749 RepID=UPI00262002DE|nr:hypothetical protein [Thermococcus sp.]
MKESGRLKEALFESRPYVEYWDRLKETVENLWKASRDEGEFLELLQKEIEKADEPFKTDLKIFLQKFEAL